VRVANIIEEGKLGGPQIRIANVAEALSGHVDTTVIMPKENSASFRRRCEVLGVDYKAIHLNRITKEWKVALRYVLFFPFEILYLVRVFRRGNFDLVHVSGGSWQYKGVIAGRLAGCKVVWHLNDTYLPKLLQIVFKIVSPLADGFIFASERTKVYYSEIISKESREFVIPAPVDTSKFSAGIEPSIQECDFKRWEGKIVVGTIANVNPIKGLDVLIEVAAHLSQKCGDEIVFVVVGQIYKNQQKLYEQLKEMCVKMGVSTVEFYGGVEDPRALIDRFDIYLCTSIAESSPIAVWEAMSMGKPIVSTDVGDVSLYCQDNVCGDIVAVGDSVTLATKIEKLYKSPKLRANRGEIAREVAIEKLELKICAQNHIDSYAALIG